MYLLSFSYTSAAVFLFALLSIYKAVRLYFFVQAAKATELPYTVVPLLETEAFAKFLTPLLRAAYHDYLLEGKGWPHWCRFIIRDWAWEDKRRAHDEYGEVFLVVSPEGIICYSADAIMGWDVMNRRNEFTKPRDKYTFVEPMHSPADGLVTEMLETYGPNVTTAEGKVYNFHVRITAPPFSDQSGANDLVWSETMRQTQLLTDSWAKDGSRELQLDVNALTLAVISLTGFGKRVNWMAKSTDTAKLPLNHKVSFLTAIHDTIGYIIPILLFPRWLLGLTPWREAAVAHQELERYMGEMISSEKQSIGMNKDHQSAIAHGNLLTSLLKASASEEIANTNPNTKKSGFTDNEIMGNLFLYLLAGYETTANAILYALIVLALRPDIQANVVEEITRIYQDAAAEGRHELTYAQDFQRLTYTYGFMYETFRIYPGGIIVTKMVEKPTAILVSSTEDANVAPHKHILPAQCRVYLNAPAVHYTERYWPDPTVLDPSRWDNTITASAKDTSDSSNNTSAKKVTAADKTRQVRGSLLTFSGGARACLGRKFAQSEFVSFLVTLLKDHDVVLGEDMDPEAVQKDIDLRAAGRLTLSPVDNIKLRLRARPGPRVL